MHHSTAPPDHRTAHHAHHRSRPAPPAAPPRTTRTMTRTPHAMTTHRHTTRPQQRRAMASKARRATRTLDRVPDTTNPTPTPRRQRNAMQIRHHDTPRRSHASHGPVSRTRPLGHAARRNADMLQRAGNLKLRHRQRCIMQPRRCTNAPPNTVPRERQHAPAQQQGEHTAPRKGNIPAPSRNTFRR